LAGLKSYRIGRFSDFQPDYFSRRHSPYLSFNATAQGLKQNLPIQLSSKKRQGHKTAPVFLLFIEDLKKC
jgi:hypothetical protein